MRVTLDIKQKCSFFWLRGIRRARIDKCGLSRGFKYEDNTHVAFVPCAGQNIEIENDRIRLVITDARQIDFQSYKPNPAGEYTDEQRTCRNWIFANYLLDGMPL